MVLEVREVREAQERERGLAQQEARVAQATAKVLATAQVAAEAARILAEAQELVGDVQGAREVAVEVSNQAHRSHDDTPLISIEPKTGPSVYYFF